MKYTLENLQPIFKKEGYEILSSSISYKEFAEIRCPEGHVYKAKIRNFLIGRRCPTCYKKSTNKSVVVEKTLKEEGYQLLTPFVSAKTRMGLKCPKGHFCSISWNKWQSCGVRCPVCNKTEKHSLNFIKGELDKEGLVVISEEYKHRRSKMQVRCKLGHSFDLSYAGFLRGVRCPVCNKTENKPEQEISEFLTQLGLVFSKRNRKIIQGFELDFYLPDLRIGVEYCGMYWHSLAFKDENYHLNKFLKCYGKGIVLFTIFEDGWLTNKEGILSVLETALLNPPLSPSDKIGKYIDLNMPTELINNRSLKLKCQLPEKTQYKNSVVVKCGVGLVV